MNHNKIVDHMGQIIMWEILKIVSLPTFLILWITLNLVSFIFNDSIPNIFWLTLYVHVDNIYHEYFKLGCSCSDMIQIVLAYTNNMLIQSMHALYTLFHCLI
jgi:hypothetical protein